VHLLYKNWSLLLFRRIIRLDPYLCEYKVHQFDVGALGTNTNIEASNPTDSIPSRKALNYSDGSDIFCPCPPLVFRLRVFEVDASSKLCRHLSSHSTCLPRWHTLPGFHSSFYNLQWIVYIKSWRSCGCSRYVKGPSQFKMMWYLICDTLRPVRLT